MNSGLNDIRVIPETLELEAEGWVISSREPVREVRVYLDDRHLGSVPCDRERPDVAASRSGAGTPGWRLRAPASRWYGGENGGEIEVRVLLGEDELEHPLDRRTVDLAWAVGGLDSPQEELGTVSEELELVGWAFGLRSPVEEVVAVMDGREIERFAVTGTRPDVQGAFPEIAPEVSGWQGTLDLPPGGPTTVELQAEMAGGHRHPIGRLQVAKVVSGGVRLAANRPFGGRLAGIWVTAEEDLVEIRVLRGDVELGRRPVGRRPPPWALKLRGADEDSRKRDPSALPLKVQGRSRTDAPWRDLGLLPAAPEDSGWRHEVEEISLGPGPSLELAGWVLSASGPVARVEVRLGESLLGRARLGLERHDLTTRYTLEEAPVAGFEAHLDLAPYAGATSLPVELWAYPLAGQDGAQPVPWLLGAWELGSVPEAAESEEAGEVGADPVGAASSVQGRVPAPGAEPGEPLTVAVYSHRLDPGGAQLYLVELLRRLAGDPGLRFRVISPEGGALRELLEDLEIEVERCDPFPAEGGKELDRWRRREADRLQAMKAQRVLVNTLEGFAAVETASDLGLPSLWSIHESYAPPVYADHYLGDDGALRGSFLRALDRVSLAVFETPSTAHLFRHRVSRERQALVPYGVDLDGIGAFLESFDRRDFRARWGFEDEDLVLVCVGVIEPRKGQARLVQAFARLAAHHPRARLVLVGDLGGATSRAIHEVVERCGLADRVRILPVVEEIYPWYAAADVKVLASDLESMPRSVLEAMAFGIPVAGCDAFGLGELLGSGARGRSRRGWTVPPNDLQALIAMLEGVLGTRRGRRRRLGAAGRKHVHRHHDAAGYAAFFREALRRTRGPGSSADAPT